MPCPHGGRGGHCCLLGFLVTRERKQLCRDECCIPLGNLWAGPGDHGLCLWGEIQTAIGGTQDPGDLQAGGLHLPVQISSQPDPREDSSLPQPPWPRSRTLTAVAGRPTDQA